MTAAAKIIVVPIDGSPNSERAAEKAIEFAQSGLADEIHLVNVQYPVSGTVTTFVGQKAITGYHYEEGMKALAAAKAKLEAANMPHQVHIAVGTPAEVIVHFAKDLKCGHIVMGTRGIGGAKGALLGSVARDVIAKADVPVTLVK